VGERAHAVDRDNQIVVVERAREVRRHGKEHSLRRPSTGRIEPKC
jgi:hypothetical protein